MVQGALDHRLGTRLAVFLQKIALERTGVDADAHGTAVIPRSLDHLADPLARADVARVYAQAGSPRFGRFDRPFIVEVDVRDDRHRDVPYDTRQRRRRLPVRTRHPNDVRAGQLELADLPDGRLDIRGQRVGHRLDADRRAAADHDSADTDRPRLAAANVAIGTDAHGQALKS